MMNQEIVKAINSSHAGQPQNLIAFLQNINETYRKIPESEQDKATIQFVACENEGQLLIGFTFNW